MKQDWLTYGFTPHISPTLSVRIHRSIRIPLIFWVINVTRQRLCTRELKQKISDHYCNVSKSLLLIRRPNSFSKSFPFTTDRLAAALFLLTIIRYWSDWRRGCAVKPRLLYPCNTTPPLTASPNNVLNCIRCSIKAGVKTAQTGNLKKQINNNKKQQTHKHVNNKNTWCLINTTGKVCLWKCTQTHMELCLLITDASRICSDLIIFILLIYPPRELHIKEQSPMCLTASVCLHKSLQKIWFTFTQ